MKKFGRLKILKEVKKGKRGEKRVLCICDCKTLKIINYYSIKSGIIQSCGCLLKDKITIHKMSFHPFYSNWTHLKQRCKNIKNDSYKHYGGRGITYDPKWENFLGFKEDMYMKYIYAKKRYKKKNLSIERVDVNGNYCFENCIFIPRDKQLENTRKNKWFIAINKITGEQIKEKNIRAFARKYNIDNSAIAKSLKGILYHKVGNWTFKYCG